MTNYDYSHNLYSFSIKKILKNNTPDKYGFNIFCILKQQKIIMAIIMG